MTDDQKSDRIQSVILALFSVKAGLLFLAWLLYLVIR